ncbi:hypothetical protein DPMN_008730 [Dreissena polymorpha]|uniref:Uncharacterized protein n=1 Tax=Dreissena polymorpha TaxID=45954 RepID=A0A9D4RXM3_DREPO|nr:hypothetical protein DPMN_008730 [Dreissena polymorpha]
MINWPMSSHKRLNTIEYIQTLTVCSVAVVKYKQANQCSQADAVVIVLSVVKSRPTCKTFSLPLYRVRMPNTAVRRTLLYFSYWNNIYLRDVKYHMKMMIMMMMIETTTMKMLLLMMMVLMMVLLLMMLLLLMLMMIMFNITTAI